MDEFLDKMQEDQRRMRRYLRAHGAQFKQMGEALGASRALRSRVFVIGEPPLDALCPLLADEYLTHLPALPVDLSRPGQPSVDPDESGEVPTARQAAAKQVGRHLHPGDVVLALLHDGNDKETRIVLEAARAKRVTVLVLGGLEAKSNVRRLATVRLSLPTHGIKTIVESSFVCARILARVSRAASREAEGGEEADLVQATCDTCNERVFHEERSRGREVACPLCQAPMKVPRDSARRAAVVAPAPAADGKGDKRRRMKPSAMDLKALELDDEDEREEEDEEETGAIFEEEAPPERKRKREAPPPPPTPSEMGPVEAEEAPAAPTSRSPRSGSRSRSDLRSDVGVALPRGKGQPVPPPPPPPPPAAPPRHGDPSQRGPGPHDTTQRGPPPRGEPVGLVSHDHGHPTNEPSFGSDILVGSDVVAVTPPSRREQAAMITTASADPFALEDAFLADLEMPRDGRVPTSPNASGSGDTVDGPSRRLSARFSISECRLRWGRGGYPDESGPPHELVALSSARLEFFLDPDDEGGSTLQKGDELWLRLEIPAFIEPVLAQGILLSISGTSGDGRRGTRVELEFQDLDPVVRRKLARAAESMGAPA